MQIHLIEIYLSFKGFAKIMVKNEKMLYIWILLDLLN